MNKTELKEEISRLFQTVEGNVLTEAYDIKKKYIGTVLFDEPIVGFGDASDALFDEYKKPGVIGPWHMSPTEWLDDAKTVFSPSRRKFAQATAAKRISGQSCGPMRE